MQPTVEPQYFTVFSNRQRFVVSKLGIAKDAIVKSPSLQIHLMLLLYDKIVSLERQKDESRIF